MQDYSESTVLEGFKAMCYDPRRFGKMKEQKELETPEKPAEDGLDLFRIEVEQKQRRIYVLIEAKDPLDALDIAHAIMFKTACLQQAIPSWKVIP